jgi:sugar/nucleoside kinase (ribokinase family)
MPDVVTLGDINVDIIARVPYYPSPGGDSLAEGVDVRAGGSAANAAIVLGKFGLDVSIIARVGEDILADLALSDLREAGVDLSHVQRDAEARTGVVFAAVTPDGERTFFSCRGANTRAVLEPKGGELVKQAKVLHVSGYAFVEGLQRDAALSAVEEANRSGVPVSLDLGVELMTTSREDMLKTLSMISMIFPNQAVAEWLTGERGAHESVEALLSHGAELVGLKLGDQGCLIGSAEGVFAVPAFQVIPVDDTGAGDSFDAGLLLGHIGGLSLRASGILANMLGAAATAVTGGGISLPSPEVGLSFLEEQHGEATWQGWSEDLVTVSKFLARRSGA